MIITISREFGSGGRELGKRLSEALKIPCFDKEIIEIIAKEQGLDEGYVSSLSEKSIQSAYPLTIGHRFSYTPSYVTKQAIQVAVEQCKVIERFAEQGDCIIIGRCADILLKKYKPFNIFVYASTEAKLQRCIDRSPADEHLTRAEIEKRMKQIDKNRANQRGFFTDTQWGAKENYHLCINTSDVRIKMIVPLVTEYVRMWFSEKDMRNE